MKRRDFIRHLASIVPLFFLGPSLTKTTAGDRLEAERKILGELLADNGMIGQCALRPEAFSYDPHKQIFKAMVGLDRDGTPVDLITLQWWLSERGCLDEVGGADYLASLLD